jgi:ectoine hydroxylase-related dioxygenase (phytanoyl-CoA dioxygenase family)
MQSMLFIKHAGKPGQAWHQDEDFIPTRDRSLTAAWIALDDATIDNGCLWAIPGSHRSGVLWPLRRHVNPEYDSIPEAFDFPYEDGDARPIEVAMGSVVFFNGYLLHKSLANRRRSGFRRALVNHYMRAESLLPWWRPGGPHPPTQDLRDVVLVAGADPYAARGYEDVNQPYIRSEASG